MISRDMQSYDYFTLGTMDAYGQPALSTEVKGTIKMSINTTSQATQDNIRYKDATYIGLTHAEVDDTFVIKYGEEKLKVLNVNPKGRYKQAFMKNV